MAHSTAFLHKAFLAQVLESILTSPSLRLCCPAGGYLNIKLSIIRNAGTSLVAQRLQVLSLVREQRLHMQ